MKKLCCSLSTFFLVFALHTTVFALSLKVGDVQAEAKATFADVADAPSSTDTTVYMIAAKGKGESKSNAKYYLYFVLAPKKDKVDKIYSFKKDPVKLTFAKNGVSKTLTFKVDKGSVNTISDWNYMIVSRLLIKEVRDELVGITDLKIMLPLANGSYKTLVCPKTVTDGWDYVLTVDLDEVEKNANK